jgi:hypothetical protein
MELSRNPKSSEVYLILTKSENDLFPAANDAMGLWMQNAKAKDILEARCVDSNAGLIMMVKWAPLTSDRLHLHLHLHLHHTPTEYPPPYCPYNDNKFG